MMQDIVGPGMLIVGIFFGVLGVFGIIYYIRKVRKGQDSAMFGL